MIWLKCFTSYKIGTVVSEGDMVYVNAEKVVSIRRLSPGIAEVGLPGNLPPKYMAREPEEIVRAIVRADEDGGHGVVA